MLHIIKKHIILNIPCDFTIGGHERPYLLRWFIIPRNRFFNIYLHKFLRSDDDRALLDHFGRQLFGTHHRRWRHPSQKRTQSRRRAVFV